MGLNMLKSTKQPSDLAPNFGACQKRWSLHPPALMKWWQHMKSDSERRDRWEIGEGNFHCKLRKRDGKHGWFPWEISYTWQILCLSPGWEL